AEEDCEPQVEVLEDPREDGAVLFKVEDTPDVSVLQLAIDEHEVSLPAPVEVGDLAILGPLLNESGTSRRSNRGEGLSVVTQLDVELASVGVFALAPGTGVLDDESGHRASRSEI